MQSGYSENCVLFWVVRVKFVETRKAQKDIWEYSLFEVFS